MSHEIIKNKATAHICKMTGDGVVWEPDGRIFLVTQNEEKPIRISQFEVPIYLNGGPFFRQIIPGEYPYTEMREKLNFLHRQSSGLLSFMSCCDGKLSLEERLKYTESLEEDLKDPNVEEYIRDKIPKMSLEVVASFDGLPETGKLGALLKELKKTLDNQ